MVPSYLQFSQRLRSRVGCPAFRPADKGNPESHPRSGQSWQNIQQILGLFPDFHGFRMLYKCWVQHNGNVNSLQSNSVSQRVQISRHDQYP